MPLARWAWLDTTTVSMKARFISKSTGQRKERRVHNSLSEDKVKRNSESLNFIKISGLLLVNSQRQLVDNEVLHEGSNQGLGIPVPFVVIPEHCNIYLCVSLLEFHLDSYHIYMVFIAVLSLFWITILGFFQQWCCCAHVHELTTLDSYLLASVKEQLKTTLESLKTGLFNGHLAMCVLICQELLT